MKKIIITLAIAMLAGLQGCLIKSVHPFFREADIIYNGELLGTWEDQDRNSWSIRQNPFKKNSYLLSTKKVNRSVEFSASVFSLKNQLYLDMMPVQDNSEEVLLFDLHLLPTHSIAKITSITDERIDIKWFNEEWLHELFKQNKIRMSHELVMDSEPKSEDDGTYLLTASTEELQKFIMKYGDDEQAYGGSEAVMLALKKITL